MAEALVSVACLTYNHEYYIRDAINGFLIQETTFPFEIIIHDDASTDSTASIVKEYSEKYPHLIFPICQRTNQYSQGHGPFVEYVFPRCGGKYIALCEGDDYWTDPDKLQKQVDFLEANPEYGLCYTSANVFDQETGSYSENVTGRPIACFEELLITPYIPTLTTMFRKELLKGYASEVQPYSTNWKMGDYPLWLYIAAKSKTKFQEGITATYRMLGESASHSKNIDRTLDFATSAFEIRNFFADKFHASDATRKKYTLYYFCDTLYWAFLINRTELVSHAKAFFEANEFAALTRYLILFEVCKKNRFALRVLNHFVQRYKQCWVE
jgi:glycosyltransferase involved in cell wall biosynthesis